jgi:hypothetical protein
VVSGYTWIVKRFTFAACLALALLAGFASGCSTETSTERYVREHLSMTDEELLLDRLAGAVSALRSIQVIKPGDRQRYARIALDSLVGRSGRHGRPEALPGSVLPADGATPGEDRGLALRVYDAAPTGSPVRTAVETTILGDFAAWQAPRDRYDAVDRAVAAYRRGDESLPGLISEVERGLALTLLTHDADSAVEKRALAARAAAHLAVAQDALRLARVSRGQ